jgi:hypothetical protein
MSYKMNKPYTILVAASLIALILVTTTGFNHYYKCGFTVFGIPRIFDSIVLTGLSFDNGLLRSQIAAFCSGVNDDEDEDDGVLLLT